MPSPGEEGGPGVRRCHSPKLVGAKLVTAAACLGCYCRDHAPAGEPADAAPDRGLPCAYQGRPTGERRRAGGLPVLACLHPGHAADPRTTETDCKACRDFASRDRYYPLRDDPPCGVVIGSYKWPALIELQIKTIRHFCGPAPILVSDDCSPGFGPPVEPGGRFARLQETCNRYPDVTLWPNVERIGHGGGDVAAFWKGIIYAQARGLRVLAKLSQRFLLTIPRWLQDGARDLLESGLPLAAQRCRGVEVFDLRTEAMLLDVESWGRPEALNRLMPRRYGQGRFAETTLYQAFQELPGGIFWPWQIYTEERYQPAAGVIWHTSNTPADYRNLAARFSVELDDDFTTDGWQNDPTYLHG